MTETNDRPRVISAADHKQLMAEWKLRYQNRIAEVAFSNHDQRAASLRQCTEPKREIIPT